MILVALALVSAGAFFYYGATCIMSMHVRQEYRRYGIPHLRVFNGTLQMFGAGGVLIGLALTPLGALASLCLCILMLLGLQTRHRLHDPWRLRIPATTLAILNAVLFVLFLRA
ncbi:MAG: hypothetical protein WA964_10195 [Ilumatobacter sp.]|uniref:DoxX family protein n=1 Tax=Ilumatobacter sp. TaxID=1967498 RepID=UPI003C73E1F8